MTRGLVVDLFAGGGGASVGLEAALGRDVDVAVNHDPVALAVHKLNHPHTRHLETDIWEVHPLDATGGAPVDVLWASPDCTHFSVAKGAKPRKQKIRSLAWAVVRWAAAVRPSVIFVENVAEFRGWGPLDEYGRPVRAREGVTFARWRRKLESLGYIVDYKVLDASHYGTPTRRKRLFLIARCDGRRISWPAPTHGEHGDEGLFGLRPVRTAAECIDWSLPCPSIFDRARPLARPTLRRIALGIQRYVVESDNPYIVKDGAALFGATLVQTGYGERKGQKPRVPGLDKPLGTVVNGQKHALVAAFLAKHYGGVVGTPLTDPIGTVTAKDHHSLADVKLARAGQGSPERVRAFLTTYYTGGSVGQSLNTPLRSVTAKSRLGLVTVAGEEYQITDIGMRMLQPHELLACQFGRFAAKYDLSAAPAKTDQIRLIGNSVCPEVAEAIVSANLPRERRSLEVAA